VIAGDSTRDRRLARAVASVAPACRPGHEYQLAYVTAGGTLVVRDADSGQVAFARRLGSTPQSLSWSADGQRLLVLSGDAVAVFDGAGHRLLRRAFAPGAVGAALSPDGKVAAVRRARSDAGRLAAAPRHGPPDLLGAGAESDGVVARRSVAAGRLAGSGPVDLRPRHRSPRIVAVSRIAEQFTAAGARPAFPRLDGWCCTGGGTSG
jgi:hypothetical protein